MSLIKFFLIIFSFYILVNLLFTFVYYFIGTEHLSGLIATTEVDKFIEAFFFSAQTFTTVGYGRVSPTGFLINAVSSFQALVGLLSFAVATGLMYARFSLPKAYIKYSTKAIIAPYDDINALMIRLAPYKNTGTLTDAEAKITLVLVIEENGVPSNKFFNLSLEMDKINSLAISWTLVHPINEESPLYNFKAEDYQNTKGEILIYLKAFDDTFSNSVISRTSYEFNETFYGGKFSPMYKKDKSGQTTVIELDKLSDFKIVAIP